MDENKMEQPCEPLSSDEKPPGGECVERHSVSEAAGDASPINTLDEVSPLPSTPSNNKQSVAEIFNRTSSSLCNLLVYTSGESGSEDEESGDSDSYDCESDIIEINDKPEPVKRNTTLLDTLKSMGELSVEDLPPVPDISTLNISVKQEECDQIGKISSIVDKLVMVESLPNKPAYDIDTLLFLDNGKQPLGYIFDVIGAVVCPMYAIRFNSTAEIAALNVSKGLPVYCAPKSEHTQYVFVQQLLKAKGSDASWKNDMEVPQEHQDFSDDESESNKRNPHSDVRKRNSVERYRNFEKDMNVKNMIDTRLHKIRDTFEPSAKKPAPSYYKRGNNVYPPNFRPSVTFTQAPTASCAFPNPCGMPPAFLPSSMPMQAYAPAQGVPYVVNRPPPPNFRLPPPIPNMSPYPPNVQYHHPPEMVNPMFNVPRTQAPVGPQVKAPQNVVYPPDMGLPRPPSANSTFVPNMPFFDPRVQMWHGYPTTPNTRQNYPRPRTYYPRRQ